MLANLKIKNFRMLSDFSIPKLGNVNLIVGKNNSGKSSVLEALRIYAARGNPRVLQEIAASHDELATVMPRIEDVVDDQDSIPFKDFFHGRKFPLIDEAEAIYIGDIEKTRFVRIDHSYYVDEYEKIELPDGEESSRRKRVVLSKELLLTEDVVGEQALTVTLNETQSIGWIALSDISAQGYRRSQIPFWERAAKELPVSYVPTQFLSLDYLAQLWDSILFTPYADDVKAALQILDENFEDLAFIKAGSDDYRVDSRFRLNKLRVRSDRSAVVKLKGSPTGIPLSSMGDGMLRVLQLALTVFPAKGGILLIDEFENGLHWSVQEKIWGLIFKLASDLNIQVFATTHSEDAVKAFSEVANALPEEGVLIKLVRKPTIDGMAKTVAVVYDEETLQIATMTETEVR